jgi:hypothetical protein
MGKHIANAPAIMLDILFLVIQVGLKHLYLYVSGSNNGCPVKTKVNMIFLGIFLILFFLHLLRL